MVVAGRHGEEIDLSKYKGRVVLVVNTASQCGFTKQYDALEELYQRHRDHGLVVLGFPSNDFMGQEPGSDSEIESFCRVNFGVTFDLFPKAPVKGELIQPLFKALTTCGPKELRGGVRWNFEKFLISKDGKVLARFRSSVTPESPEVVKAIEGALK
jgi:glutathione peroxidase